LDRRFKQVDVRVSVALALVREKGLWLVGKRAGGRVFAGLWEFPGGKIQPGETASQAAVREVLEETGLAVKPVADLGTVETAHGGQTVVLHLVACRVRDAGEDLPPVLPQDLAVTELRWVSPDELQTLPMPPANAEVLQILVRAGLWERG
jgi:mutator protein MutT